MTSLPSSELAITDHPGDLSRHLARTLEPLTREITSRRGAEGWLGTAPEWPAEPGSPAIAVALCTLEGRFIEVNDTLVSLTGYARDEIVGRSGTEVGLWGDVEDLLRCLRSKGAVDGYVLSYRTGAGQTRYLLLAARLLTLSGRGAILALGVDVAGGSGFDYESTL